LSIAGATAVIGCSGFEQSATQRSEAGQMGEAVESGELCGVNRAESELTQVKAGAF